MSDLAESLRLRGLLCPIRVRPDGHHGYVGVFGERRWRAAQTLGWPTITAVVAGGEPTETDRTLEQLSENVFRDDLRPIEKANAYLRVMTLENWTAKELASHLGVSPGKVSQDLRLLDLSEDIQASVNAGRIPASVAYEIARAREEERPELARQVTDENATRGQIRAQVRTGGVPPKAAAFSLDIPAGPYRFAVAGNRITVSGKKIDSPVAVASAARALAAATAGLVKQPDKKASRRNAGPPGAAVPGEATPPTTIPSLPDPGHVAGGGELVPEAPKEGNS